MPQSSQLSQQLRQLLGAGSSDRAAGSVPGWEDIASAADFYTWMEGPLKTFLFAPQDNKNCGRGAREGKDPKRRGNPGTWAPMICQGGMGDKTGTTIGFSNILSAGCTMRQVRVTLIDAPARIQRNGILQLIPDYTHAVEATKPRGWNDTSIAGNPQGRWQQEHYSDDSYPNTFGVRKNARPIAGSRLIGAEYPGQSGMRFGGNGLEFNQSGVWMAYPISKWMGITNLDETRQP